MKELSDTIEAMTSKDYKVRFTAEYMQTKIRYEKLKGLLNRWDATEEMKSNRSDIDYLGFVPSCPYSLLRRQLEVMQDLLHVYEVRAVIEGIDLTKYE